MQAVIVVCGGSPLSDTARVVIVGICAVLGVSVVALVIAYLIATRRS